MRVRSHLGLLARAVAAVCLQASLVVGVVLLVGLFCAALTPISVVAVVVFAGATLSATTAATNFAIMFAAFAVGITSTAYRELSESRAALLRGSHPNGERERDVERTVDRLAQQAGVRPPSVRIVAGATPACYTVPGGPTLVVSTGLLDALDEAELTAVLAHEVAHLANRDTRVMAWALAPVAVAEEVGDPAGESVTERAFGRAADRLLVLGELGLGVFSRGREFAADRAAAELTGDPAALASALRTVADAESGPPDRDLRAHATTVDALSVLPTLDPSADCDSGLTATHPSIEARIERLQRLQRRFEAA